MKAGWVLVIEANPFLCKKLASGIEARGLFLVSTAGSVAEAGVVMAEDAGAFDAIVLNEQLPDGTGLEFCAGLRDRGDWTPVIMIANRVSESDVVRSFAAGADDHLVRPTIPELVARLRAQIRAKSRRNRPDRPDASQVFAPAP